jgi:hypothetical protein
MKWNICYLEFSYHTNHGPDLFHEVSVFLRRDIQVHMDSETMVISAVPGCKLTLKNPTKENENLSKKPQAIRVNLTCEENAQELWNFIEATRNRGCIDCIDHEISLKA